MNEQRKIRVLIAEDDFLAGEMIKSLLGEMGYEVVGKAVNGRQAIEMTQSLRPDLALMDIKMPDMDGIAATQEIQAVQPTPVVMLTAYETEELAAQASAAGAGAYVVKPPDARTLQRAIIIALARFADMAALRRSNARLEKALTELETTQEKLMQQERLAAVGQLAAGIAHEYNNVMASIILYADLIMRGGNLSAKDRERLVVIQEQGQRAADLTQKILDFASESVLHRQNLDANRFLHDIQMQLARTLPENIRLHLTCPADEVIIFADPDRLRQIVINLTLNAREAMPQGGDLHIALQRLHVAAGADAPLPEMDAGDWAVITVADNGVGIAPEALPHIFEPFFTTRAPLGSGLGLAQVYGIVKQHGGFVDVSSELGKGTTFWLYLPRVAE
ncbi:MAG: response regulator [Chloroflexi bacterium]|nr:response regulator [Chloroflexota bacterium]